MTVDDDSILLRAATERRGVGRPSLIGILRLQRGKVEFPGKRVVATCFFDSALRLAMLAGSTKIVSPVPLTRWTTPGTLCRWLTETGRT